MLMNDLSSLIKFVDTNIRCRYIPLSQLYLVTCHVVPPQIRDYSYSYEWFTIAVYLLP